MLPSFSSTSLFLFLFPKEAFVFMPTGIYRRVSLRKKIINLAAEQCSCLFFFFFKVSRKLWLQSGLLFFLIGVQTQWKSFELAAQEKNPDSEKYNSPSCKNKYIVVLFFLFSDYSSNYQEYVMENSSKKIKINKKSFTTARWCFVMPENSPFGACG